MICLLPHCAYLSETSRMLELHRALTELGLEVRVATHSGPHERLLAETAIRYDVLGPGMTPARATRFVGDAIGLGDPRQSMYDDAEIRTYVAAEAEYFRANEITVAVTGFTVTTLLSSLFAHLDLPMPAEVQQFLDHPGPTIYLAMTSTPPAQVRTAIAELSRLDARILVAGTIHDLGDLATDQIMIEGILPSYLVMPQVDLAVTGGQGSVQTAMACGTPLLGIPLHIEQDLNIALVERLGAARHLGRSDNLADLATQMLNNNTHLEAAERIQKLYAAVNGPTEAATLIAQHV